MRQSKLALPITLLVGLLILLVAGVAVSQRAAHQYGQTTILFQLPDTQGLSATLNNQKLSVTKLQASYKIHDGSQQLQVTKPGYKPFSASFTVTGDQALVINVTMQSSSAPQSRQTATTQVGNSFTADLPSGTSLVQAVYFYSNTWVVATISSGGDNGVIVARYIGGSQPWQTMLGPGTLFQDSDLSIVPPDVATYMVQQHYAL